MDIIGVSLGYTGLGFMKNGGFFTMLKVTSLVFCALLSIPILKQRLKWFKWIGIAIICAGIIMKSVPYITNSSSHQDEVNRIDIQDFMILIDSDYVTSEMSVLTSRRPD